MITPFQFLQAEIRPALYQMEQRFRGLEAECMLTAIPGQETNYNSLYQLDKNGKPLPHLARGLYQFELIGVKGCLDHPANTWLYPFLVRKGFLTPDAEVIHRALPASSSLSIWIARANLWWYPKTLPAAILEAEEDAWYYYLETWRPGKPNRKHWTKAWTAAVEAVKLPTESLFSVEPMV